MTSTGLTLDLRAAKPARTGVAAWVTKKDAAAALAAYRECGLNMDRDIEMHQIETDSWLHRFWVIGLPDHFNTVTYLMRPDGTWMCGRIYDNPFAAAPWELLGREPKPATVTHTYRYSAGSQGVLGSDGKPLMSHGPLGSAEVLHYMTRAWCIACTWSTTGDHEESTRLAARWHRANPDAYAGHATPRHLPKVGR